ncbi:MAG: vancomycin high temperature exclusion protein [Candidatus Sumerlaeia bacterium]
MKIRKRKIILIGLPLLVLLGVASVFMVDRHLARYDHLVADNLDQVEAKKVGLVLGTAARFGSYPNLFFRARVDAAEALYNAGKVKQLLLSGDNSRKDYSEPDDMKDALIKRGIPEENIYLDYAGFSTLDSVVRAKDVFHLDDFIIVSQRFHCQRALYIAKSKGITATAFAAQDVSGNWGKQVRRREILARMKAFLDVNILKTQPVFLGEDPYGLAARELPL